MAGIPLVRWLSKCNAASRTQARILVRAGRVRVNGRVCVEGVRTINPLHDVVTLDGDAVRRPDAERDLEWWALNKPRGVVSTTADPEGRPTVMDLLPSPHAKGLAPVGRLDRASAGLLLVTNDAEGAARLLDPAHHVPKTYRLKIRGHPLAPTLARWREQALETGGLVLGPMDVTVEREGPRSTWLRIVLREGKNRQIRRRMEAEGHEVEILVRERFGPIALGDLPKGHARRLASDEVGKLRIPRT